MTGPAIETLAARARAQIEALGYPRQDWTPARQIDGRAVLDAAIIGAGQSGVAIALGLRRENVRNLALFDTAAGDDAIGPWGMFARMPTLRTPKTVSGPECGIPALLPEAWYRASHGDAAWDALDRIPTSDWAGYMAWLRRTLELPIHAGVQVTDLIPRPELGVTELRSRDLGAGTERPPVFARAVVVATGIEGGGCWSVPEQISSALPRAAYAHTSEPIDFAALRGKRVAVLGGGASAFDNAGCALEAGARVDMFVRRDRLPPVNPYRWMEFTGFLRHFPDLDDDMKWAFMQRIFRMNQPPPQPTYDRCVAWKTFAIHYRAPFLALGAASSGGLWFDTPDGRFEADFLIVGTGLKTDLSARPELARIAPEVATWADRYAPAAGPDAYGLGDYPYLSPDFQFQARNPARAAALSRIFCYTFAAMPSTGCAAGISALKFGAERVTRAITRQLFREDAAHHLQRLMDFDIPELRPEDAPAPWLAPAPQPTAKGDAEA